MSQGKILEEERESRILGEKTYQDKIQKMCANRFKCVTFQKIKGNPPQGDQQGPLKLLDHDI